MVKYMSVLESSGRVMPKATSAPGETKTDCAWGVALGLADEVELDTELEADPVVTLETELEAEVALSVAVVVVAAGSVVDVVVA